MDRRGMPTVSQRDMIASYGLNPSDYVVISCSGTKIRIAHRGDGSIRKLKRTAGAGTPGGPKN